MEKTNELEDQLIDNCVMMLDYMVEVGKQAELVKSLIYRIKEVENNPDNILLHNQAW